VTVDTSAFSEVMVLHFESLIGVVRLSTGLEIDTWLSAQQDSLDAVIENHKKFLSRVIKVRLTIEDLQRKRKMIDMMASLCEESSQYIITPDSIFRPVWSLLVIFGTFYFMLIIPFRILWNINCSKQTYESCLSQWDWTLVIDYLVDALFLTDVGFNALVFAFPKFESQHEVIVVNRNEIFEKFRSSWRALISVIALVPMDLLALSLGWIQCLRFTKLIWMFLLFENIDNFLNYFERYRKRNLISTEGVTVLSLAIISTFAALYMAIVWCVIHNRGTGGFFVEALYFCLTTMTTVGYGDIVPTSLGTTFYVVCLSIIGPSACATIIANAASYMINTDSSIDNITHRLTVLQTFLQIGLNGPSGNESTRSIRFLGHDSSSPSSRSPSSSPSSSSYTSKSSSVDHHTFLNYVENIGRDRNGIDEKKLLLTMLPDYLQDDLQQFLTMDLVLSLKLFHSCDTSFLRKIMLSLELQYLVTNKVILCPGVPACGMYLVHNGTVQIFTAQGRKTIKRIKGDSFGEIFLFEDNGYCNFKAESINNSEVWYLCRTRFLEVMSSHGISADSLIFAKMNEVAKESCKSLIDTPLPSLVALQAIQELRANTPEGWILRPDSLVYQTWTILLLLVSIYNLFLIPFGSAFMENHSLDSPIIWLQYTGDLISLLDIILRLFFLGYLDQEDHLILSQPKITQHYLHSSLFWLHLLSAIPFDLFLFFGPLTRYESLWQTLMMYRVNKLLRLVDLPTYFHAIEESLFATSGTLFKHSMKLLRLIFIVFIAAHIAGCLFFIVANQKHYHGSSNNWADYADILRSCSLDQSLTEGCSLSSPPSLSLIMLQYIYSIYWATGTLTTVGYGDIFPISIKERIFCLVIFFIGTTVYTLVITCLQDIVSNLDVTSDLYKHRYDRIRKLMLRENSSEELKRKATCYLQKLWTIQRGATGEEIQQFLSLQLYAELNQCYLKKKFDHLFYLKQCSLGFRTDLCAKLEIHHYLLTDFLFHTGEAALSLYFIMNHGEIALVNEDSGSQYAKIFANSQEGGVVGEAEFFTKSCYSCAAQVTKGDLLCYELSAINFWNLLEQYNQQEDYKKLLNLHFLSLWKRSTQHLAHTLNENLKNSKMTKMLTTICSKENYGYYITPTSLLSRVWTVSILLLMSYALLSIPYCIAFADMSPPILLFDSIQSLFFMIDIYLNIRYFSIEVNGILIKDWKNFSHLYLDSPHLKYDLLATLPLPLLVYAITADTHTATALRLLYIFHYFHKFEIHSQRFVGIIESYFDYRFSSNFLRMVMMVLLVWYFGHIASCILCFIGKISTEYSWLDANNFRNMSAMKIYLRGYLWAMYTIITVGYGSIQLVTNIERIFAVCIMLSGAILCDAGVTAVLSSLIAQTDKQNAMTRRSKQALLSFSQSNQLPDSFKDKISSYFHYLSNELDDCVEIDDYKYLPKPLYHELIQAKCYDALCSLCLIDLESSEHRLGFVYSMIRYMVPTLAIPGQILLQVGDETNTIHILRRGKVYTRYYSGDGNGGGGNGIGSSTRDYFQEGEALCHEERLHTTNAISPGKLVQITLGSLQSVSISNQEPHSFTSRVTQQSPASFPFLSAAGSATFYTKLSCGARKARSSNKSSNSKMMIKWNESFTFHVPRAVTCLQITIYDDKLREVHVLNSQSSSLLI
jgi:CRP-like cAMP-binding protein